MADGLTVEVDDSALLAALIAGIGFASVAAVQQTWQLPAAYALAAFGMGFVFPSFQALAADAVQAHEQGAAAGTVAAAQGLGMVAGPMLRKWRRSKQSLKFITNNLSDLIVIHHLTSHKPACSFRRAFLFEAAIMARHTRTNVAASSGQSGSV